MITRGYGFVAPLRDLISPVGEPHVVMWNGDEQTGIPGVNWVEVSPGHIVRQVSHGWRSWFGGTTVQYPTKLPFARLKGSGLTTVWETADGEPVIAWVSGAKQPTLLVGLDIAGEIIRCRQGDPNRTRSVDDKSAYGFEFERPTYLFSHQMVPGLELVPVADQLGFWWAETLSRMTGIPLIEPLPGGARGLVLLTGDDDQADLSRYARQLGVIGALPITYYLHPLTHHTPETLAKMPPNVDYGVHVDALEAPAEYAAASRAQCRQIRGLCARPARTVRNHGFLNDGYLGHLTAWEADDLRLDLNIPGLDGTVLTGSFLPFRLRRQDGSWSAHFSLLTAFGDGMVYALKMTAAEAAARILAQADRVDRGHGGVLVFNMHPQNIIDTEPIHAAILSVAARSGWLSMTAEQYLDWLEALDQIRVELDANGVVLESTTEMRGVTVRRPSGRGWVQEALPSWIGTHRLELAAH